MNLRDWAQPVSHKGTIYDPPAGKCIMGKGRLVRIRQHEIIQKIKATGIIAVSKLYMTYS